MNSKQTEEYRRRLLRTTLIRVTILTILLVSIFLFLRNLHYRLVLWPLPLVLLATYLLNAFVWIGVRKGVNVVHLTYPQLIWDVFVITEIVYYTGSIDSPFIPFYFLVIYEASIFLGLRGSLIIAGQSSLVYGILIWSRFKEVFPEILPSGWVNTSTYQFQAIVINIYLYASFFFLTAFISGYLAERLRRKGRQLESTSHMLKRIRLDTDNIMKNMAGGLVTVDHEGKIVYFNLAAERILGYRESNIKGKTYRSVFAERMSGLCDKIQETLETGIMHSRCEIPVTDGKNEEKPIGLTTALVRNDTGMVGGVIINFQDLTQVKHMEQMVRQSDRMAAVGELSAGIAHEIRNPLASISGAVEVLKESTPFTGENEKLMDLILRESERLNGIIREFLEFARLKTSAPSRIDLPEVVDNVLILLQNHPRNHDGIHFDDQIDTESIFVFFDEDQLTQLLINLMVNSMEAMPDGGYLRIGLVPPDTQRSGLPGGDYITIFISDTGKGVDESVRGRIFEPFVSTKQEGTGLGLSIVQRIVESNRGKIMLDRAYSQGARFLISLPCDVGDDSAGAQVDP